MRLIDADELKRCLGLGGDCKDCRRNVMDCGNNQDLTHMDVCSAIDDTPSYLGLPLAEVAHWLARYAAAPGLKPPHMDAAANEKAWIDFLDNYDWEGEHDKRHGQAAPADTERA